MSGLIFVGQPAPGPLSELQLSTDRCGATTQLGPTLFDPKNWHQSLSDRHSDDKLAALLRAGALVKATAVAMTFNRIVSKGEDGKPIQWQLLPRGTPEGFPELLSAVRKTMIAEGIYDDTGHQPHITISYSATQRTATLHIEPVVWILDELLLVRGGGTPYCYTVLGRWPLQPQGNMSGSQLGLL